MVIDIRINDRIRVSQRSSCVHYEKLGAELLSIHGRKHRQPRVAKGDNEQKAIGGCFVCLLLFSHSPGREQLKRRGCNKSPRIYKGSYAFTKGRTSRGTLRAIQLIKFIRMRLLIFSSSDGGKGFRVAAAVAPFKEPVRGARVVRRAAEVDGCK